MSENKFSVPVKTPIEKKKSETAVKKAPKKKNPVSANKKETQKPSLKKDTRAKNTTSPAPEKKEAVNMSVLTPGERHSLILGKGKPGQKSVVKKSNDRSVSLDVIKKEQEKKADKVTIKEIGRRKGVSKFSLIPIIWIMILLLFFMLLFLTFSYYKKTNIKKTATVSPRREGGDPSYTVTIRNGLSAKEIVSLFSPYVNERELLSLIVENGLSSNIKSGTYTFERGYSPGEIAASITRDNDYSIKIFDGFTIKDIDEILSRRDLIKTGDFIKACEKITEDSGLKYTEGWFLSGTYELMGADIAASLSENMHNALLNLIKTNSDKINQSQYSISDLLIIASMINRETQDYEQMRYIASVIYNRLEKDMPLGIDATTRYEIDDWTRELKREVLDGITPYNTRRKKGLPPSGIGCVSEKALNAVLDPYSSSYLYYFHKKDGSLVLSNSYEEHLALSNLDK